MDHDKKIGILTLHSGYNEGGILQAFCLASNLQNSLINIKVEVTDHRYPNKVRAYGPVRDDKTRVLHDFVDNALPLSRKRFESDDHQATFEFIKENYSALITGSDELWKLNYTKRFFGLRAEQRDPWCPAFPNVYWPDESIRIPKIAYAASIGKTEWKTIPSRHIKKMKSILSHYALLGIRDERTMSFMEWLDPNLADKAERVPDPAFSIDVSSLIDKQNLKEKLKQWGVDFDRPRIGMILKDTANTNKAILEMKKKGFQIVGLSVPNGNADVALFDKGLTPLEWFGVFALMDLCVSQRMHACISCIVNNTPFIAVDFYSNPMDDDTKIRDLMQSFNLLAYYYNDQKDSPGKFSEILGKLASQPWPVTEVAQRRILFQNRSKEFTEKIQKILKDTFQ
ncbi:MAG: polysaccharide pyruvyl transferase family protein [Nitrospirae bacterium]|nr:polysaccharide pyruvyl transferase family protein [Nitrospirota bacterium]